MRFADFVLIALVTSVVGCQSASNAPDPQWLNDFQKADTLLIEKGDQHVSISDAATVARLQLIYANAKWKPYLGTLPGNLGERTIWLLDDETRLRRFDYTGALWEAGSYTENRTAKLSEADRDWIETLFSMVPESEAPRQTNNLQLNLRR